MICVFFFVVVAYFYIQFTLNLTASERERVWENKICPHLCRVFFFSSPSVPFSCTAWVWLLDFILQKWCFYPPSNTSTSHCINEQRNYNINSEVGVNHRIGFVIYVSHTIYSSKMTKITPKEPEKERIVCLCVMERKYFEMNASYHHNLLRF